MPLRNHYGVLNVDARASTEAIKKAYKALAIELHPDLNFGCKEKEQKFKRVTEAYHVLVDGSRRREYDLEHGLERKSSFYHGQASGGSFYYGSTRPRESPLYTAPPPPGQRPFDTEMWDAWHYGINGTNDPSMTNTNSFMDMGDDNRTQQYFMRANAKREKAESLSHGLGRDDIARRMAERRESRRARESQGASRDDMHSAGCVVS